MGWIDVGVAEQMRPGPNRVEVGEEGIAVFRKGKEFYALADMCTHAEARLSEGDLYDMTAECPLHGACFDIRDGSVRSLPAPRPVAAYPTRVRRGRLEIRME